MSSMWFVVKRLFPRAIPSRLSTTQKFLPLMTNGPFGYGGLFTGRLPHISEGNVSSKASYKNISSLCQRAHYSNPSLSLVDRRSAYSTSKAIISAIKSPYSPQILAYVQQLQSLFPQLVPPTTFVERFQWKDSYSNIRIPESFLKILQWCEENNIENLPTILSFDYHMETKNKVDGELLEYLQWYSETYPDLSKEQVLKDSVFFIRSIYICLRNAKYENSDRHIDVRMMQIFECVANCVMKNTNSNIQHKDHINSDRERLLPFSLAVRSIVDRWEGVISRELLQIVYFYVRTHSNYTIEEAIKNIHEIKNAIEPYLSVDRKKDYYEYQLNIRIPFYLWCAERESKLSTEEAVDWAYRIVATGRYFTSWWSFPSTALFSYIRLNLRLDGSGEIRIGVRTELAYPYLSQLKNIKDHHEWPGDNIAVWLTPHAGESLDTILEKLKQFFNIIENTEYEKNPENFEEIKSKLEEVKEVCFSEAGYFVNFYKNGTPPPPYEKEEKRNCKENKEYSPTEHEIYDVLRYMDYSKMHNLLANGNLDPNHRIYDGESLLESAITNVRDYVIYTRYGPMNFEDFERLGNCTTPLTNHPNVILTKNREGYRLCWGGIQTEERDFEVNDIIQGFSPMTDGFCHAVLPTIILVRNGNAYIIYRCEEEYDDCEGKTKNKPTVFYLDTLGEIEGFPKGIAFKNSMGERFFKRDDYHIILFQQIEDEETIQYLEEMGGKLYSSNGRSIRPFFYTKDIRKIRNLLGDILNKTHWEARRQKSAEAIYAMVKLLLSYGAEVRCEYNDNFNTLVENLINSADYPKSDKVNIQLAMDLLRLLLRFDEKPFSSQSTKGRKSALWVHPDFEDDNRGEMIQNFKEVMKKEENVPHSIADFIPEKDGFVKIIHNSENGKSLRLEGISLEKLNELPETRKKIVDLCINSFKRCINNFDEKTFIKELNAELYTPYGDARGMHLLWDEQGNLVGFNLVNIVIPKKDSHDPILADFRLTVMDCREFSGLTGLLCFQFMAYLENVYKKEVLASFDTASILTYLLVADLICYPRYTNKIPKEQLDRILNSFYFDSEIKRENNNIYIKTDLSYDLPPDGKWNSSHFFPHSFHIHRQIFEKDNIPGWSRLVVVPYKVNKEAIVKINERLMNKNQFMEVPEKAKEVNRVCLRK